MKKTFILPLMAMSVVALSTTVSCNKGEDVDNTKTQLRIYSVELGLKNNWLETQRKAFEELVKDISFEDGKKGVQTHIVGGTAVNPKPSEISAIDADLFFVEQNELHYCIGNGIAEDITDAVAGTNEYETGKKIEDKLTVEQKDYFKKDNKYYAVPHFFGSYGIVYNKDYFAQYGYADKESDVPSRTEWKEKAYPEYWDEFTDLCDEMQADSNIKPVVFSGQYYSTYVTAMFRNLMANQAGVTDWAKNYYPKDELTVYKENEDGSLNLNETEEITLSEENGYRAVATPAVKNGVEMAKKFIDNAVAWSGGEYALDKRNVFNSSISHTTAENYFLASYAGDQDFRENKYAMLVDGTWWQSEATSVIEELKGKTGFDILSDKAHLAYMPLPFYDEDTKTAREGKHVLGDSIVSIEFVKKGRKKASIDAAKKFIQYINTDKELVNFTKITNTLVALDYKVPNDIKETLTPYTRSLIDFKEDEKTDTMYPISPSNTFNVNFQYFNGFDIGPDANTSLATHLHKNEGSKTSVEDTMQQIYKARKSIYDNK